MNKARLIQDIDFTDEDMDRVERETASLLREGLIQRIALREAELATLRADASKAAEELAQLREIIKSGTFYPAYESLKAELSRERERHQRENVEDAWKRGFIAGVTAESFEPHEEADFIMPDGNSAIPAYIPPTPQPAPVDTGGNQ